MWSIMASPLLLSLDVRSLGSFDLSTYNNTEVIAGTYCGSVIMMPPLYATTTTAQRRFATA